MPIASTTGCTPFWNVRQKMSATGSTSRKNRYTSTTVRMTYLARPRSTPRPRTELASTVSGTAGPPSLQHVQQDEHDERDEEQDGRDRGRRRDVVALDLAVDVDGCHLRLERQVAGDQHRGAELADRPGEREGGAGQHRREQAGQEHPAEGREAAGPQRVRGLLDLRVELDEHGLHRPHDERQRDEEQRDDD